MTLFLRVSVALLAGFLLGVVFVYLRLRNGLTSREWAYFKAFHQSLIDRTYDDSDIERSEDNAD